MELELIMYSISGGDGPLTEIIQLTKNSPHVGCFISDPFTLKDNVFWIFQSWEQVLMDVMLGTQLYRMRMSAKVTLDISVFTDTKESLEKRHEMQTIIRSEEKHGSAIRFLGTLNASKPRSPRSLQCNSQPDLLITTERRI